MHVPRRSLRALGAALAAGTLLAAASTAHADAAQRPAGPRTLNPQPEPPGVALKRGKNNSMEIFAWYPSVVEG